MVAVPGLKPLTEKPGIVFLLIVLCLVFLSQCYVYADTEAGAPSHSTTNVLESPQIDSPLFKLKCVFINFVQKLKRKPKLAPRFLYEFQRNEFIKLLKDAGFKILQFETISHDVDFAHPMNKLLTHRKEKNIFHKNKTGRWDLLTTFGKILCNTRIKNHHGLLPTKFTLSRKKEI